MEGVEEREAAGFFSAPGLDAEGALSGALTPARLTGHIPGAAAAAAVATAATLLVAMADAGLG